MLTQMTRFLVACLVAVATVGASNADATSVRRLCRRSCANAINSCVQDGATKRFCRREIRRACRKEGIGVCIDPPDLWTADAKTTLNAPGSVTATAVSTSAIDVQWIDTSTNEDGFEIWRRQGSASSFELVATVSAGTQSRRDSASLQPGTYYEYEVRSYVIMGGGGKVDFSSYSSPPAGATTFSASTTTTTTSTSTTTTIVGSDTTAPSIPTGLVATVLACDQVALTWNASSDNAGGSGLAGYRIYRWNAALAQWDWYASTASTSYLATGLAGGTTHYFAVTAVDNAGNESYRSSWVSAPMPVCSGGTTTTTTVTTTTVTTTSTTVSGGDTTAPSTPTGLAALVLNCSQVALTWNASTDNVGGSGLAGYRIYRWNAALGQWDWYVDANGESYWLTGLASNTTHYFAVTAVDNAGNESYRSSWVSAVMPACDGTTTTSTTTSTTTTTIVQSGGAWSRGVTSNGLNAGFAVAVDGSGRVTVGGEFAGTVDFGGGPVTSAAYSWFDPATVQDGFVAQYTASGAYRWARQIGNEGDDEVTGVAVDGSGNVIVVGWLGSWEVDLGGGPTTSFGDVDMFVAKYSASGTHLWSRRVGGSQAETPAAVAVDGQGNVWVVGRFFETTDLGGGTLTAVGGLDQDGFIVKYAGTTGACLWSRGLGSTGYDEARGVAIDGSGNAIVTGWFSGSGNFGGGTLSSAGGNDVFLAKYTSTGGYVWARRYGSSGADEGRAVAVDPTTDQIVVTGNFEGSVNFGGGTLTSAGSNDVFVAKYGSTGAHVWSRRAGGTSVDWGRTVAVTPAGDVIAGGSFARTADFGTGALTSAGGGDVFLARYAATGAALSSLRAGGAASDAAQGVALASDGTTLVTGTFQQSIDFGSGQLTGDGSIDAFLAKLTW
jgi:fibronectin type 3 domain-containing protein